MGIDLADNANHSQDQKAFSSCKRALAEHFGGDHGHRNSDQDDVREQL
jgi:hypothetical protein